MKWPWKVDRCEYCQRTMCGCILMVGGPMNGTRGAPKLTQLTLIQGGKATPVPAKPAEPKPKRPRKPRAVEGPAGRLLALLDEGAVLVTVDATHAKASLPSKYWKYEAVPLLLGYKLRPAIPDLVVDERGFRATMVFGGEPFFVDVDWEAVREMRSIPYPGGDGGGGQRKAA